tara:strand:- start:95 stop:502 length:408 start_codon:yes stop_codon:yes gene_type:complete
MSDWIKTKAGLQMAETIIRYLPRITVCLEEIAKDRTKDMNSEIGKAVKEIEEIITAGDKKLKDEYSHFGDDEEDDEDITGMISIGNNEKCPYCDDIMTKDINISKHLTDNHRNKLVESLFGKTDEEYLKHKQKGK